MLLKHRINPAKKYHHRKLNDYARTIAFLAHSIRLQCWQDVKQHLALAYLGQATPGCTHARARDLQCMNLLYTVRTYCIPYVHTLSVSISGRTLRFCSSYSIELHEWLFVASHSRSTGENGIVAAAKSQVC